MSILNHSTRSLRLFLFLYSSSGTIILSFLPVYFQDNGFTPAEIGWLMAIGPFASILIQPIAGYYSDKWKTVKKILQICLIGAIISGILMFQMNVFLTLMIAAFFLFMFTSPIGALGDSLAQKTASQYQISFGGIRMWGSVGYATTSLLIGQLLLFIGINNIMYPFLFFVICSLFVSFFLTDTTFPSKPVKVFDAFYLLKDRKLIFFLCAILFISTAHRMNDYFIGIYIMEIGGDASLIGLAWFIGVAVEALVFFLSMYWIDKYSELNLIIFTGFIYAIRFIILSQVKDPSILLLLQILHGITFPIVYTASLQYISKLVPDYVLGTGQLLFITVFFGISGILGSSIGGMIMDATNGAYLYFIMGMIALMGSIFILLYKRGLISDTLKY